MYTLTNETVLTYDNVLECGSRTHACSRYNLNTFEKQIGVGSYTDSFVFVLTYFCLFFRL